MNFTKEEQGIAKFLCEYLEKRHGRQVSVCLADSNDVFFVQLILTVKK